MKYAYVVMNDKDDNCAVYLKEDSAKQHIRDAIQEEFPHTALKLIEQFGSIDAACDFYDYMWDMLPFGYEEVPLFD